MGNELRTLAGHSAQHFGDTRDHWWNDDYIALVARRWGLDGAQKVLDVGCGVGHWGRVLSRVLPESARIVGVDRERLWIDKATASAAAAGKRWRFEYQVASAHSLPFEGGSFDLVTCQTLLIHVPEPDAVLREMVRVTRPGGLILAAEPTNVTWSILPSIALGETPAETAALFHFQLVCELGKKVLGEGSNLLGEAVPGLFAQAGLEDVEVRQNDRPWSLVPPYETDFERAQVEEGLDMAERRLWLADEATTRRHFLAGGGAADEFASRWSAAMGQMSRWAAAVRARRYTLAGGGLHYLVCGRRPV